MIVLLPFPVFYAQPQGHELTVRQMALLAFRDLVLMRLPIEELLLTNLSLLPTSIKQMLLIIQVGPLSHTLTQKAALLSVLVPTLCGCLSRESMSPEAPQWNIFDLRKCWICWFLHICGTANRNVTQVPYIFMSID